MQVGVIIRHRKSWSRQVSGSQPSSRISRRWRSALYCEPRSIGCDIPISLP